MQEIIEFLGQNPKLNLLFIGLAVLGILVSILTFLKSRKIVRPVYDSQFVNLISSKLSKIKGLSVTYNKSAIDALSLYQVAIYNIGSRAVRGNDVPPSDPILIKVGSTKILTAETTYSNNPANNFKVRKKGHNCVEVEFDYFGKFEGIVVKIYCIDSKEQDLIVSGSIIDYGRIKRVGQTTWAFNLMFKLLGHLSENIYVSLLQGIYVLPILMVVAIIGIFQLVWMYLNVPKEFKDAGREFPGFKSSIYFKE